MDLKLLWFCAKTKPYLTRIWKNQFELATLKEIVEQDALNGKIVAVSDFDCEEIVHTYENNGATHHRYNTKTLDNEQLLRRSLIIGQSIDEYLGDHDYDKNNNVVGYAIHIKNLHIFDEPKKLGMAHYTTLKSANKIQKAPQNMCIVRSYYPKNYFEKYVLISVHPEWLCLILNGLKDVELRRKVLKEML